MINNKIKYLEYKERFDKPDLPVEKRLVSVVVLYDGNGKVLLQERRSISKAGEQWGLFGGGIEKDENPKQGLERELSEEIDGLPEGLKIEKIAEMKVFYYNPLKNNYRDQYKHIFICKVPVGLKINALEGDGAKWFTYAQAKKLKMIPGDVEEIKLLEEMLK